MCLHVKARLFPVSNVTHVDAVNELVRRERINMLAPRVPGMWVICIVPIPELGKSTVEVPFIANFMPLLDAYWDFSTRHSALSNANDIAVDPDELADFIVKVNATRGVKGVKVQHSKAKFSFGLYSQRHNIQRDPSGQLPHRWKLRTFDLPDFLLARRLTDIKLFYKFSGLFSF